MSPSSTSVASLVDFPELIQTIATQRRTGTLLVQRAGQIRRLYFNNGTLIAFNGPAPGFFARCLTWANLIKPAKLDECLRELGSAVTELALIDVAQAKGLISKNVLLDAFDCYVEEGFTELVCWTGSDIQFVPKLAADQWAAFQAKLGVVVSPGAVLLEALRRQDEIKQIEPHIPDRWDVLVRDQSVASQELGPDEKTLLADWHDGRVVDELLDQAVLTPFRATRALVHLRQQGVLRLGSPTDLVVQADAANAHGQHHKAYRLYLRAAVLGVDNPRVYLHVAELAEKLGDHATAARYYVSAAGLLSDPVSSVVALRNALRLGAEREEPLIQLYDIYQHLGEKDDAIAVLIELAELHEHHNALDQAAQAVREAQTLGAEPAVCAAILARLALAEGDTEQAVLQFELVARAAEAADRLEDAAAALQQLASLCPKRFDHVVKYGEVLAVLGRTQEAGEALRRVLVYQAEASDDVLVGVHELLARVNPGDLAAHQWLADAYRRRKNRDGATEQLKLMAIAQERDGDQVALASTLERILEVGGEQIDVLKRLAVVYSRLGQDNKATEALSRSVDASLALGHLREARTMCEGAIDLDPSSLPLRIRLAMVANREGDRPVAITQYRAAADLARGRTDLETAREMLLQLRKLRPDDLAVRLELADLAQHLGDVALDLILRDLVRFAVRTKNYGVALERARQRVELAGTVGVAFEPRNELVELLRRMGDHASELKSGRELLDELLEAGEIDHAVELLQRLVVSNPRNADLVIQLAEVCAALGDDRQAQRFYRHGVCLLQLEGRIDEAHKMLDLIEALVDDHDAIAMARDLLARGQALEWEAIRWSLEQGQRRRIADELSGSTDKHPAINTGVTA